MNRQSVQTYFAGMSLVGHGMSAQTRVLFLQFPNAAVENQNPAHRSPGSVLDARTALAVGLGPVRPGTEQRQSARRCPHRRPERLQPAPLFAQPGRSGPVRHHRRSAGDRTTPQHGHVPERRLQRHRRRQDIYLRHTIRFLSRFFHFFFFFLAFFLLLFFF